MDGSPLARIKNKKNKVVDLKNRPFAFKSDEKCAQLSGKTVFLLIDLR